MQKAQNPQPGRSFDDRGIASDASVNKNMRKTGYRPDAQLRVTDNSLDPDSLVRRPTDPRLA